MKKSWPKILDKSILSIQIVSVIKDFSLTNKNRRRVSWQLICLPLKGDHFNLFEFCDIQLGFSGVADPLREDLRFGFILKIHSRLNRPEAY